MSREVITNAIFQNETPGTFPIEIPATTMPGRKNLRISVTPRCNLECTHCHNEGQPPPRAQRENLGRYEMSVDTIGQLVITAQHFGVETIKLTGGDFGMYRHLEELLGRLAHEWQDKMNDISWGINTNGVPLMNTHKMALVVQSPLNRVTFGIDSLIRGERSKPISPVGIESHRLLNSVVIPLINEWRGTGKKLDIDAVYTGNEPRILSVIEQGLKHGIGINVIEVNGVMGTRYKTRQKFIDFINSIADIFDLNPRFYPFLNQVYLYEASQTDPEKPKVKFYQDHCVDLDCGNCRKIHMRVVPSEQHVCAVPCFLQEQGRYIQLDKDGVIDVNLFKEAIPKLSVGPNDEL